jgi:hypothetical protein
MGKTVLNTKLLYPILIAMVPYVLSMLPILGLSNLMNTGLQPLISTLLLFGFSFLIQIRISEIEKSDENDIITKFIKSKPVKYKYIELDRKFIVLITLTLCVELLVQYAALKIDNDSKANIVVKGLETFYKKYKINPFLK